MIFPLLRHLTAACFRLAHRLEIHGHENLPHNRPLVLCANHVSYYDAILLSLCCSRPIRFLVFHSYCRHPLIYLAVKMFRAIPIRKQGCDRSALAEAVRVLRQGGIIGIFPEGQLSEDGRSLPARTGAAWLAAAGGAHIVPVTISGAYRVYPKGARLPRLGKIEVEVHPPLQVDGERKSDKVYLREVTQKVMERIEGCFRPVLV